MRLLMLLLILLPGMALAQDTADENRDRGILQGFLEDKLSGAGRSVRIEGFAGALSSQATLERLTIADDDGVWLELEGAVLNWNRSAILRGEVDITELSAEKLVLTRLPTASGNDLPPPEAQGFSLPELPVSIDIEKLAITRAEIGAAVLGQALALQLDGSASLAGGEGAAKLDIVRLDGPEGRIGIDASYANGTGALDLALQFREAPGGIAASLLGLPGDPEIDLTIDGTGSIDDFNADVSLTTDGVERLTGTATLGALPAEGDATPDRRFALDIGGDIAPLFLPAYHEFLGNEVTLDAAGTLFADGRLSLERMALGTRSLNLTGRIDLGADKWPSLIDVKGAITPPDGGEVLLPLAGPRTFVGPTDLTVSYDAARGDTWTGDVTLDGLRRAGLELTRAALTGDGTLTRGEGTAIGQVAGALRLDISGISLDDPALARAVGDAIAGDVSFSFRENEPLRLTGLSITSGDVKLSGDATVGIRDADTTFGLDADVALDAADLSRFAAVAGIPLSGGAAVQVSGQMDPLAGTFDLALSGDTRNLGIGNAYLDPMITGTGKLTGRLARDETGLALDDLNISTTETRLNANARLSTGDSTASVRLNLRDAGVLSAALSGPVTISGSAVQVEQEWTVQANLGAPGGVAAVIDGTVVLADGVPGDITGMVELKAEDLAPYSDLTGRDLNGALDVTLAGRGNAADLTFEASVNGTATDLAVGIDPLDKLMRGNSALAIDAARTADGTISFSNSRFSNPQASADIAGTIGGGGDATGQIEFDARLADLGLFVPDLSGPATLRGVLSRAADDWTLAAGFSGPGNSGGSVKATVAAPGYVPGAFSADVDARIASLSPFGVLTGMDLGGALQVNLQASGDISDLTGTVTASANGTDLATGIAQVDPLLAGRSVLNLDAARAADGTVTINAANVETAQASADIGGTITPTSGQVDISARLADVALYVNDLSGPATLRGTLARDGDDWSLDTTFSGPGGTGGTVTADVTAPDFKPGAFTAKADARIASLSPFGVLAGQTLGGALDFTLTASGDLSDLTGQAALSAQGSNLRAGIPTVDPLLRGDSTLDLRVRRDADGLITFDQADFRTPQLTANLTGAAGPDGGSVQYDVRVANIGLLAPGINGPATARGNASSDGSGWRVDAALTGPGGISSNVSGTLAQDFSTANLSARGDAPLDLANGFIAPRIVNGRAQFNLGLNGPLALSSLSGTVTTSGTSFTLPSLRLRLSDIGATVQIGGGRANISLDGAIASGGRLRVSGPVGLTAPYSGDLTIDFLEATVTEPGFYETTVNGRLNVNGPLTGGAMIQGNLRLGKVEVRIPDTGGGISGDLPGLVHVNEPRDVRRTRDRAGLLRNLGDANGGGGGGGAGPDYGLSVVIDAPTQIFVRGRGLDAELGGQLRLSGSVNNIITAGGFDLIRGRLDILGERLNLTEGQLRLEGDFDPYVRLVATTTSGDITVQIVIEGFASSPDLRVTSQPDLPEEEVLARLLFDKGIDQISALQAVQLALAVRTLAGGGGDGIVGRLRQNFGLDDLDVTTDANGNAEVRVGKYLSENLYSDVTVDSTGETSVNLNLQISNSVTARGSVSSKGETGLGIYFERDY